MKKSYLILPAVLLALASCSQTQNGWTLNGEIPADVSSVTLELPSPAGGWYVADSVKPDATGHFSIDLPRAEGTIYRLKLDGNYIYLPADSTETLTLVVPSTGGHVIEGTHEATLFTEVDGILSSPADSTTRRRLLVALQDDLSSSAAYYANLRLGWKDLTLLRAVTNAYVNNRPDDVRTALLKAYLSKANATKNAGQAEQIVIEAPELGYFDIELLNSKGETVSLSSIAEANRVTLLSFVNFAEETAPAVNLAIGEAHTRYPSLGIYEVGFGENQHQWTDASASLPWVNVFQSESASRAHLGQYAITQLPTMFILVDGEIKERVQDPSTLLETLKKYL